MAIRKIQAEGKIKKFSTNLPLFIRSFLAGGIPKVNFKGNKSGRPFLVKESQELLLSGDKYNEHGFCSLYFCHQQTPDYLLSLENTYGLFGTENEF